MEPRKSTSANDPDGERPSLWIRSPLAPGSWVGPRKSWSACVGLRPVFRAPCLGVAPSWTPAMDPGPPQVEHFALAICGSAGQMI